MVDPRKLQRPVRNAIFLLAILGLLYIYWRFELIRLPREGCSPLLRLGPGDLVLFDTRPARFEPGEIVLFEGPGGRLLLGEIQPPSSAPLLPEPSAFWIRTDRPDCPGLDSLELGWIPRERLRGRMLLATSL